MTEPHVTECCGQHFCKECIKKSESNTTGWSRQTKCPHCRQKNFHHFQYLPFKREINSLLVCCPRKSSGCNVQVTYGDRNSHDEKCEYEKISCTNWCDEEIFRKDLESHIENECELREYSCVLCGEVGKYNEIISYKHQLICPDVTIKCSNSCNVEFKRKDTESHKLICLEETVTCNFSEAGCQVTPKRKDLESHMYSNLKQHLSQLMTAYITLKQEFKAYKEKHEDDSQEVFSESSKGALSESSQEDIPQFVQANTKSWSVFLAKEN